MPLPPGTIRPANCRVEDGAAVAVAQDELVEPGQQEQCRAPRSGSPTAGRGSPGRGSTRCRRPRAARGRPVRRRGPPRASVIRRPAQRARSLTVAGPWPRKNRRGEFGERLLGLEHGAGRGSTRPAARSAVRRPRPARGTACRSATGTRAGGSRAARRCRRRRPPGRRGAPSGAAGRRRGARRRRPGASLLDVGVGDAELGPPGGRARRAPGGPAGRSSRAGRRRPPGAACRASATTGRSPRRPGRPRRRPAVVPGVRSATDVSAPGKSWAWTAVSRRTASSTVAGRGPASRWATSRSRPISDVRHGVTVAGGSDTRRPCPGETARSGGWTAGAGIAPERATRGAHRCHVLASAAGPETCVGRSISTPTHPVPQS